MDKEDLDKLYEEACERAKDRPEEENENLEKLSKLFGNRLRELGHIILILGVNEETRKELVKACVCTLIQMRTNSTDEALAVLNECRDEIIVNDKIINKR